MSKRRSPTQLSPGAMAEAVAKPALLDAKYEQDFQELLRTWLANGPDPTQPIVDGVFAALVQGVVLVREAAAMAIAMHTAVRAGDDAYVFFHGLRGRERCARLNPVARVVQAASSTHEFTIDDALKMFCGWLDRHAPDLFQCSDSGRKAQLAAVQRGARCFWSRHLPQLLLRDAEGELSLRPLRPAALARRATGQPLVRGSKLAPSVFSPAASMLSTANVTQGAEVISQVVRIMTQGDGTKLGALRVSQLQLLEPLLDDVAEDALGLMLVMAASAMCERGTIKATHPSHSITGRYTRELAKMFSAAPTLTGSLASLNAGMRRQAYEQLLQHAGDKNDATAALTNLDWYLVDATGCDPVGAIDGGEDPAPTRPSRYLTASERSQIAMLSVKLAPTPEQGAVVRALVAIACSRPTRPGDLIDCQYEDLEISRGRVVLNRRRRANRKAGKTSTAEGPIEFTAPAVVAALTDLKSLREGQAAMDGSPLWGRDLEDSRRLYRRACALIDSMCKLVSGDDFESFYSLRHSVCSDEVLAAFLIENAEAAQRALKQASRRADHRDIGTTVEHYFRFYPDLVRLYSLKVIGDLLTSAITSKWSGLSSQALDQRVHRAAEPRAVTLWQAISDAAPLSDVPAITEAHPCAQMTAEPQAAPLKLDDVAGSTVCTDLMFTKGQAIWQVEGGELLASSPWGHRLIESRSRYAMNFAESVRPAAIRQQKLEPVARRLRRFADSAAVRTATALWRASVTDGFIDVSTAPRLNAWLIFFKDCGVPAHRLVIRVDPSMSDKTEVINAVFSNVTMQLPLVEMVPWGKGRPAAYLLICSKDLKPGVSPPPATTSMVGFNGLMVAACMREDLTVVNAAEGQDATN